MNQEKTTAKEILTRFRGKYDVRSAKFRARVTQKQFEDARDADLKRFHPHLFKEERQQPPKHFSTS
jgi:hypothetical protein